MKSKKTNDYVKDIEMAKDILKKFHLLKSFNNPMTSDSLICTYNKPVIFRDYLNNAEMRNENKYNFTFELIDNSLIYFNLKFRSKKLYQGTITYISGAFEADDYSNFQDGLPEETVELKKISYTINDFLYYNQSEVFKREDTIDKNKNNSREYDYEYEDYLIKEYFKDKVSDNIIKNILKLNRNEVIIRMDYDEIAQNEEHPKIHLTINNLENSRYKIETEFLVSDFIYFILDLIYGEKCNRYSSYLKIN